MLLSQLIYGLQIRRAEPRLRDYFLRKVLWLGQQRCGGLKPPAESFNEAQIGMHSRFSSSEAARSTTIYLSI